MDRGLPSMTALLGLLAVAGFQNRDKIAEMLRGATSGTGGSGQGGFGQGELARPARPAKPAPPTRAADLVEHWAAAAVAWAAALEAC